MEFKLLGPLEVLRNGILITPSAPKLRGTLALLALRRNEIVTFDQVIEELWDQRPPNSANTTMQTYIYQLRKLFRLSENDTTDSVTLSTTPGGYRLNVAPEAVDVSRFEQELHEARSLAKSNSLQEAADAYRKALALWRGAALSDIRTGALLTAETVRLEEIRKSALEQQLDLYLELGRHNELIIELTWLTSQEPTHEGFFVRLMLALARTGRRTEALGVYQRCRRNLIDHLGLEPSFDVQKLHNSLLTSDTPEVLGTTPQTGRVESSGSRTHSARVHIPPRLFGRAQEFERTVRTFTTRSQDRAPIVVVTGRPGSGKSEFCRAVAQEVTSHFPDGTFVADLHSDGRTDPVDRALGSFLLTAGLRPADIPDGVERRSRMLREWTASHKALFVLDNVTDPTPLLPVGAGGAAIVASRRRIYHERASHFEELPPLSHRDGVALLVSILGADRVNGESAAAHQIVDLCEGLPTALRAVAARLIKRPHWTLDRAVERLRHEHRRLDELTVDKHHIRRSIDKVLQLLPVEHRAHFQRLASRRGQGVTISEAADMLGTDETTAEDVLDQLVEFHLAVPQISDTGARSSAPFRYALSPLHCLTADASATAPPAQYASELSSL